jgi:hypothetical protein
LKVEHIRRERNIRLALHAIAQQRVATVLPGNVVVIEMATPDAEWFDIAARTCLIRGWVEVLHDALPTGKLTFRGDEAVFPTTTTAKPMYRLTEGGWAAINRSHAWVISTFFVAFIALIVSVGALYVAVKPISTTGPTAIIKSADVAPVRP